MIRLSKTWNSKNHEQMEQVILVNPAQIVTCMPETFHTTDTGTVLATRITTTHSTFLVSEDLDQIAALCRVQWRHN